MHLVEEVPLYQTVYLPILVHSSFLIEFFVHFHWVLLCIVKNSSTQKFEKMFEILEDSDAVFDEDSEYALGLMIRASNDDKSSIFRNCYKFFLQKNSKKTKM